MRVCRRSNLDVRRKRYREERIEEQGRWYRAKSHRNAARAHTWTLAAIVLELLGVVAAAARAFGELNVDLLGVLAAGAASVTAWVQGKQHQITATAYAVAAQELAAIRVELREVAEPSWGEFVDSAEGAISREHTLWRASRGVRRFSNLS